MARTPKTVITAANKPGRKGRDRMGRRFRGSEKGKALEQGNARAA
jgi:hypothetical protein